MICTLKVQPGYSGLIFAGSTIKLADLFLSGFSTRKFAGNRMLDCLQVLFKPLKHKEKI